MDQEFEGLHARGAGEPGVLHARGVVCDGADDAAGGEAVTREDDGAGLWGLVFGVDEAGEGVLVLVGEGGVGIERARVLVWGAEMAGARVAVVVGPTGDGCHGYTGAEDVGDIGFCGGG